MQEIYERIRKFASAKGLSLTKLEELCGLSNGSIGKWKNQNPSLDKFLKVVEFSKMPIEYFLPEYAQQESTVLNNSINQSPNATYINSSSVTQELSKQETQIIELYRSFDLKKQMEFLKFLLELQEK